MAGTCGSGSLAGRHCRHAKRCQLRWLHILPSDHTTGPCHADRIRLSRQSGAFLSRHHRATGRALGKLGDENHGATANLHQHAARACLKHRKLGTDMQELDPVVLLAVFQEMLGPLLWPLLAVIGIGTLAFLALILRERKLVSRRLVWSQAIGLLGGLMALVFMARISASGYSDAAGPADWILIALVFAAGAAGTTVIAYTLVGWAFITRTVAKA